MPTTPCCRQRRDIEIEGRPGPLLANAPIHHSGGNDGDARALPIPNALGGPSLAYLRRVFLKFIGIATGYLGAAY